MGVSASRDMVHIHIMKHVNRSVSCEVIFVTSIAVIPILILTFLLCKVNDSETCIWNVLEMHKFCKGTVFILLCYHPHLVLTVMIDHQARQVLDLNFLCCRILQKAKEKRFFQHT